MEFESQMYKSYRKGLEICDSIHFCMIKCCGTLWMETRMSKLTGFGRRIFRKASIGAWTRFPKRYCSFRNSAIHNTLKNLITLSYEK